MTITTPLTSKAERRQPDSPLPTRIDGDVRGTPRVILRLEAAIILVAALVAYAQVGSGWILFAVLFLIPDLSMLGYLLGRRIGAAVYNVGHSYILPAALGSYGYLAADRLAVSVALIWIAHIGFDRLIGYGLKYATAFHHTHLGLGQKKPPG
jgi:Domain of unknown function (DUF4260)